MGNSITTDTTGVYVTGNYDRDPLILFNAGGAPAGITLPNSGNVDAFIVKYNTSGTVLWATRIAGANNDQGLSISSDDTGVFIDGGIYVTGVYTGTIIVFELGGLDLFDSLTNSGGLDTFIVKYNFSGMPQWSTRISSAGDDHGYGITYNNSGVYVTGSYRNNITFYSFNSGTTVTLTFSETFTDMFVAKYNNSGVVQWATRITGGTEYGRAVTADSTGIYVTGEYSSNNTTIYNQDGSIFGSLPGTGSNNCYIVKYNTLGFAQWATRITGVGTEFGYSIKADDTGVYLTGSYSSNSVTLYSYNNPTTKTLPNQGFSDVFIARYSNSGIVEWASRASNTSTSSGNGITTDTSGVYVTGSYANTLGVYNSDDTLYKSLPDRGAFLIKYSDRPALATLSDRTTVGSKVLSAINNGNVNIAVDNLLYNGTTATTIVLNLKGETIELGWNGTEWFVIDNKGGVIT